MKETVAHDLFEMAKGGKPQSDPIIVGKLLKDERKIIARIARLDAESKLVVLCEIRKQLNAIDPLRK